MTRGQLIGVRLVGVLLVVSLVAPGCGLLGGGGSYQVTTYFSRAVSLYESSQVRVLGLPAGRVAEVTPEGDRIRVVLEIDDDVPVPADAGAAIVPQSLIGERYVQLFPAWTDGDERLPDGAVIPFERTTVPVEPDEALAALKEFLDTLDPDGAGRLVTNLADTLEGNGANLGSTLQSVSRLQATLAAKDEVLASIVEQLDDFTATLVTRETQLGQTLDLFAEVTATLAAERRQIEGLVANLAEVSDVGLDLVSRHSVQLRTDVERLTRTLRTVEANLGGVAALLSSGDDFPQGLADAFDPEHRRIDLRVSLSPVLTEAIGSIPGLPAICLPLDVECTPAPANPTDADVSGRSGGTARPVSLRAARTPIDDIVDLLTSPGARADAVGSPSTAERVGDGVTAVGGFLGRAVRGLLGTGR